LEAVALEGVNVVEKYALSAVKTVFIETAERQNYRVSDLPVREFIEVEKLALPDIYCLITEGTTGLEEVVSCLAECGVDTTKLIPLAPVFVHVVLEGFGEIVRSCSLKGASMEDFKDLFEPLISFGLGVEMVGIDQAFLQDRIIALLRSLIECFHEEYSGRLEEALAEEEWSPVEPERTHIGALRRLIAGNITSFTIGADAYNVSRSLLILFELTSIYLDITRRKSGLSDEIVERLFVMVELFATGSSHWLQQPGRTVTGRMLAISASGLHFYAQLIPFVKLWMFRSGAREDLVDQYSDMATKELKASCEAVMSSFEDLLINAVETELVKGHIDAKTAPKQGTEIADRVLKLHLGIVDCFPSLRDPLFDRVRSLLSVKYPGVSLSQGRKEPVVHPAVSFVKWFRRSP
jgi:hypothetical protein